MREAADVERDVRAGGAIFTAALVCALVASALLRVAAADLTSEREMAALVVRLALHAFFFWRIANGQRVLRVIAGVAAAGLALFVAAASATVLSGPSPWSGLVAGLGGLTVAAYAFVAWALLASRQLTVWIDARLAQREAR